jgi:hypothetical protein
MPVLPAHRIIVPGNRKMNAALTSRASFVLKLIPRRGPMRPDGCYVAGIWRACVVNTRLRIKIKLNLRPKSIFRTFR